MTRTCLVSESNLFRAGLKHILAGSEFDVAFEAGSLSELDFDEICRNGDDACETLVLVRKPPDIRTIEPEIVQLKQRLRDCRTVVLAGSLATEQMAISFAAGTDGYLLEEISSEALLESLTLVMLGEKVFPSRLAAMLSGASHAAAPSQAQSLSLIDDDLLSRRELDVVQRLAGGMSNKLIARELEISEATVKVHLKSILKKLGVTNRTQAAIWALNKGVAALPQLVRFQ